MTVPLQFDVVVIGAGVAGLVSAVHLQRAGVRTLLIEGSEGVGGLLASTRVGEHDVDGGAESFASRNNVVAALVSEWGIAVDIASPNPVGAMIATRTRTGVRRIPLPWQTALGIPGRPWARDVRRSIGVLGVFRALLDGIMPPRIGRPVTGLGALVQLRMGRRVRTRLVEPLCRSVYSIPAGEVEVVRVLPTLRSELARRGSLARAVRAISSGARPGSAVQGLSGGLWQLAPALAKSFTNVGGVLWTGTPVTRIGHADGAQRSITVGEATDHRTVRARHVVLAVPGPTAARLTADVDMTLSAALDAATFRGVTVTCAQVLSASFDSNPVGTGVIAGENVATRAKALTHLNAKWAWLASRLAPHEHLLRLSFDGVSADVAATAANREAIADELSTLSGVCVDATQIADLAVSQWPDAVVPLDSGIGFTLTTASLSAEEKGITCVGSWVSGTGLATVIPYARAAMDRVILSQTDYPLLASQERQL